MPKEVKRVKLRGGKDAAQSDFDPGPGEVSSDAGFDNTGKSQVTEINIGDAPTVFDINKVGDPSQNPKSINVRGGIDYTPSTFDPGRRNIFQKGFDLIKKTVTNQFVKNVGFGLLGGPIGAKFGLSRQIDLFNKARAVKSLFDQFGPMADQTIEDVLEEETGQTTALYKDGGLVTLFREKR